MSDDQKFVAPYVPFATFETGLDKLAALGGIPPKIDHTVFTQMGGMQKGQVISAFKFLGLIDADGVPIVLADLALKKEKRKETLRALIAEHYPNVTEQDLATMSPGQLDTKLADKRYNVTGATRQKARTFLLKAAEYCGIPLSKLLTTKGPRGPRKNGKKAPSGPAKPFTKSDFKKVDKNFKPIVADGTQKTIQLNNGGSVTLSIDVNIMELKGKDREFVFELIDKLDQYSESLPAS